MADDSEIVSACERRFSFLVEQYGFEPAQVERIGCETYVRFHRGDRTVSIAWEPGLAPIVEIVEPPRSFTDKVEFWAERNGVARSRRIPRLRLTTKFEPNDRSKMEDYFGEVATQLKNVEASWLAT